MSVTIIGNPTVRRVDGGRFWKVSGFAQFSTTDLTGELPINSLCSRLIGPPIIAPIGTEDFSAPDIAVEFGTSVAVAASAKFLMVAPRAGTISAAGFTVATTVATDAANIWTVGILNTTQTLVPVDIAGATNSNNSTGGAAFTSDVLRALTLGAAGQLAVAANDVLEWTFTKASSAANLVELNLKLMITPTTGLQSRESLYLDEAGIINTTNGLMLPVNNPGASPPTLSVTVTRKGTNPTSGLIFGFEYTGY